VEKRINALVSEEIFDTLKTIAEEKGATMTSVLRQAITLAKWFHQAQKEGARVMVEREGKIYDVGFF